MENTGLLDRLCLPSFSLVTNVIMEMERFQTKCMKCKPLVISFLVFKLKACKLIYAVI